MQQARVPGERLDGVRVGLRCDAGPVRGAGHVVRCLALAEEVAGRGGTSVLLGDVGGLALLETQLAAARVAVVPVGAGSVPEVVAAATGQRLDAVVLDSYDLPDGLGQALTGSGIATLAVVDDDARGVVADVYVEQNLGSERLALTVPAGARLLAGAQYALVRDAVRRRRPAAPPAAASGVPRVVAFFGGTDPFGAAPPVLTAAAATGRPFHAQVVAATDAARAGLARVELRAAQSLEILDPTPDLPRLLAAADLVVSAAGTATWDLLCLGLPAALVAVVDNQEASLERVTRAGVVAGLGLLSTLRADPGPATATLDRLLGDPDARTALARAAWGAVDGEGRVRVVDVLGELLGRSRPAR